MDIFLYLLIVLITYDLSLHLFELLWILKLTTLNHPLYIAPLFNRLGRGSEQRRGLVYQIFWTGYWFLALVLLLLYLLTRPG